ncbi:coiled-coil domain-containing protein 137 [Parambassis ranga]|uniref:Coiled-coil domain-containing protein 137 n=1 Tax=Parambassis ranga TaxID=210632 RepID=A0A6P7IQK4_9TELE|nr:coiled-coil domain-containing protein 137 [Parambassis ranga]
MGKNNNKVHESGKQPGKGGEHTGNKKVKKERKTKKDKQGDHIEHIPFKLREIMKSKDRMKKGAFRAKQPQKDNSQDGDIPVPHFKRGKKESEKAYVQRMESTTKHVLFLSNNQVDRKPELSEDKQEKRADNKSGKKKEYDKTRLQRLHQKKMDKQEDKMEKEMFVDDVPFGEVTMAPPSLSARPKKAQVKPQRGSKDLLLNTLLGHTASSTAKPSMARQRIMEEERQRAVEAYRHLKKQKQQQHEARIASIGKLKNLQ